MSLEVLYSWLWVSSVFVIVGVILEGEEIVAEIREAGWKSIKHIWSKIGFGLLVIGLAGELFFQTRIESADAELKRQSDTKIATAQTEAAKANERANKAIERANILENEAERLKAANLALETRLAPRRLTAEQQVRIGQSLKWFLGKRVVVESYGLDVEAKVFGNQLMKALRSADIFTLDFLSTRNSSGSTIEGIYVSGSDDKLAQEIVDALKAVGLVASNVDQSDVGSGVKIISRSGRVPPADVDATIFVGVKPVEQ